MSIFRYQSLNPPKAVMIKPFYHLNVLLEVQILLIKVVHFATRHDKNGDSVFKREMFAHSHG